MFKLFRKRSTKKQAKQTRGGGGDGAPSEALEAVRGEGYDEGREALSPKKKGAESSETEGVEEAEGDGATEEESGFTTRHGITAGKDFKNPGLEHDDPDQFQLTLVAAVDNKHNTMFQEVRTGSTVRNRAREFFQKLPIIKGMYKDVATGEGDASDPVMKKKLRKGFAFAKNIPLLGKLFRPAKTKGEIRKKGMRQVRQKAIDEELAKIETAHGLSMDQIKEVADNAEAAIGNVHQVGHTYVRLTAKVGAKAKEISSFGFYPGETLGSVHDRVPGSVVYPDDHEGGSAKAKDYTLSSKSYLAAFDRAASRKAAPPNYFMPIYNCTTFGKEVAEAAGVAFNAPPLAPKQIPAILKPALSAMRAIGMKKEESTPVEEQEQGRVNLGFVPETYGPGPLYDKLGEEGGRDFDTSEGAAAEAHKDELDPLYRDDIDGLVLYYEENGDKAAKVLDADLSRVTRDPLQLSSDPAWVSLQYDHPENGVASYFAPTDALFEQFKLDALFLLPVKDTLWTFRDEAATPHMRIPKDMAEYVTREMYQMSSDKTQPSVLVAGQRAYVDIDNLYAFFGERAVMYHTPGLSLYDAPGGNLSTVCVEASKQALTKTPTQLSKDPDWTSVDLRGKVSYAEADDVRAFVGEGAWEILHEAPPERFVYLYGSLSSDTPCGELKESELPLLKRDMSRSTDEGGNGDTYVPVLFDGEERWIGEHDLFYLLDDDADAFVEGTLSLGDKEEEEEGETLSLYDVTADKVLATATQKRKSDFAPYKMSPEEMQEYRSEGYTLVYFDGELRAVEITALWNFSGDDQEWLVSLMNPQ